MTTGIFIVARAGSSRLKEKHFLEVFGVPILSYLIERIKKQVVSVLSDEIKLVIVTGKNNPENKLFEQFGIEVFYGNDENIPLRLQEASSVYKCKYIIPIDGDDILCSPDAIRKIFEALQNGSCYAKTIGLPLGMNVMGFSADYLTQCISKTKGGLLETGWGRIFNDEDLLMIETSVKNLPEYRFTLDYFDDFKFFEAVIHGLGKKVFTIEDVELIKYVDNKEIYKINSHLNEEYWDNFHRLMTEENEDHVKQ